MHRRLLISLVVAAASVSAQAPELGQGYVPELILAARRTIELAEAIPADKYSWRPAPGVRTVSEVLMHTAIGDYWLLSRTGVPLPAGNRAIGKDTEKTVTDKAEVIAWLKDAQQAVLQAYGKAELSKPIKFFERDAKVEGVYLRILVHNHEHMGQMIAYARSIGVKPPWSD